MLPRVLFVDDDNLLLTAFKRAFRGRFDLVTVSSGQEALTLAQNSSPFAVVVADMQMPEMNGIEFLQEFARINKETSRIMLTGQAELGTAIEAVNLGHVFRFLNKPCAEESLATVIEAGIQQYLLVTAERMLLEDTLAGSIQTMVELLSEFDSRSFGDAQRVRDYALKIAVQLGLQTPWDLGVAALLSKIGRLALPMEIQLKASQRERLSAQQMDLFRKVPEIGSRLVAHIPRLQSVSKFIYYSAKSFDGEGYPVDGISGQDLPIESRILKVADDFVARLNVRQSKSVVVAQMKLERGKYDPAVLSALAEVISDLPASAASQATHLERVDHLRSGMVLASDVQTTEGLLILAAGTRLAGIHIERMRTAASLRRIEDEVLVLSCDLEG
jgi:response regulator RpfG family c-di-GMP phosphodiesterase